MHIHNLSITLTASYGSRDYDQRILVHEIPYASLVLGIVARRCEEVEFEGGGDWEDKKQADELQHLCKWPRASHSLQSLKVESPYELGNVHGECSQESSWPLAQRFQECAREKWGVVSFSWSLINARVTSNHTTFRTGGDSMRKRGCHLYIQQVICYITARSLTWT